MTTNLIGEDSDSSPSDGLVTEAKTLLTYLAVGVLHQYREIERGSAGPATLLDPYLQLGWDKLAQFCYRRQATPPRHLPELARWLHQTPAAWPDIGSIFQTAELDGALLYAGAPTQFCNELGREMHLAIDPERELGDLAFKNILDYCHTHHKFEQYTLARRFLVENPYLPAGTVTLSANLSLDRDIREWLAQAYEPVPTVCIRSINGQPHIALCSRCSWPLQWRAEQASCYSDLCAKVVKGIHDPREWHPYIKEAVQTKRAEQASIVGPERALLQVHQFLSHHNLRCELWPQLDACDLLVSFPHGSVWAVDLKDHESPKRLALGLRPFTSAVAWDKAFYLFPDYRRSGGYLRAFKHHWAREKNVDALFVKDFMARVEEELDNA